MLWRPPAEKEEAIQKQPGHSYIRPSPSGRYCVIDKSGASPNTPTPETTFRVFDRTTGDTIASAVRVARYAALAVEGSALSNKRWDDWVDPSAGDVDIRD